MSITTGTPDTRTEHSKGLAGFNVMVAVLIPAALFLAGLFAEGFEAVSWLGAIVWGVVAGLVMTGVTRMARTAGMTRMNLLDMLGSMVAEPGTDKSRNIGLAMHLVDSALLALAWVYTMAWFNWPANWFTGLLWGAFISVLALLMLSSIGVIHPKIRQGRQDDPGPAAINMGKMTPVGLVIDHLIYGFLLGILYQWLPLS